MLDKFKFLKFREYWVTPIFSLSGTNNYYWIFFTNIFQYYIKRRIQVLTWTSVDHRTFFNFYWFFVFSLICWFQQWNFVIWICANVFVGNKILFRWNKSKIFWTSLGIVRVWKVKVVYSEKCTQFNIQLLYTRGTPLK